MKTSKAYHAKLNPEDQAAVLAAPDGAISAALAARALAEEPKFWKRYYQNETLNRLANTVWHGCVFGEKTMLDMMAECCDEAQFIEHVNNSL